jgi:hypothetical protein
MQRLRRRLSRRTNTGITPARSRTRSEGRQAGKDLDLYGASAWSSLPSYLLNDWLVIAELL